MKALPADRNAVAFLRGIENGTIPATAETMWVAAAFEQYLIDGVPIDAALKLKRGKGRHRKSAGDTEKADSEIAAFIFSQLDAGKGITSVIRAAATEFNKEDDRHFWEVWGRVKVLYESRRAAREQQAALDAFAKSAAAATSPANIARLAREQRVRIARKARKKALTKK